MDKVAIYARVSTEDKQDFDRQISDLKGIIFNHGYKDNQITIYAEKISGYKKERPELNKLLSEVEDYKCIYVTEISRLGRNPKHTREVIEEITDKKVPIYIQNLGQYSLDANGNRSLAMNIIIQIMLELSHQEAETMKSRMKSGKLEKITKKGIVPTANLPYGYKNVNKMLKIDAEEAEVVKMIFELCLDGNGTLAISNKLNELNIPTRRNKSHKNKEVKIYGTNETWDASNIKWNDITVRQIIQNTMYYGVGQLNKPRTKKQAEEFKLKGKEIIEYPTPAIISEDVYKECNELITSRITKGDATYTYLLKNLMYCGECGKKYIGVYQPTSKAQKAYKCLSNKRNNVCKNCTPQLFLIESVFYDMFLSTDITEFVSNPNNIKKNLEIELNQVSNELANLKLELENKEAEEKRILKLYAVGKIKEELLNEMNDEVQKEINSINEKLGIKKKKELELKRAERNYKDDFNSFELLKNAKANRSELRSIFKQLISKVIINKINDGFALLTFYPKLNGVDIKQPVNIIVDIKSVRKNPHTGERKYRYISSLGNNSEPIIENGITKNLNEIIKKALNVISTANKQQHTATQLPYQFKLVDKKNYIYMDEKIDA